MLACKTERTNEPLTRFCSQAWYPSVQATLADHRTTQLSYVVAAVGYLSVSAYGFTLWGASCK
jgi:hypothetical protein